jgi:hypothetical protein
VNHNIIPGDLVMFRKPNVRWTDKEEPYIYGMIKKIIPPGSGWNNSWRLKYNVLSSAGRIYYEVNHEKIIILSKIKKT